MNTSSMNHFVARPWPPPSQPIGEHSSEAQAPVTDALVADHDAAGGQDQFDVTQAQAEAVIQPDCVLDDLGGKAKAPFSNSMRCARIPLRW